MEGKLKKNYVLSLIFLKEAGQVKVKNSRDIHYKQRIEGGKGRDTGRAAIRGTLTTRRSIRKTGGKAEERKMIETDSNKAGKLQSQ